MLGDFYPLFPHAPEDNLWFGYQFHRNDVGGGMAVLFRREKNPEAEKAVQLRGLNPDAVYEVSFEGSLEQQRVTGREAANLRVQISEAPGSVILYYQEQRQITQGGPLASLLPTEG